MSFRSANSVIIIVVALILAMPVLASPPGGISPQMLQKLRATDLTPGQKTMADIIANHNVNDVALNRERFIEHNKFVDFTIKSGSITNQKGSGRCWMFAGFNTLRPLAMKNLDVDDIEFSENYLFFWDKLEKTNTFLQQMIDMADRPLDDRELQIIIQYFLGDGGWWSYFVDLISKYGVVPKEVMPETQNSSATGLMNKILRTRVADMGIELRSMVIAKKSKDAVQKRKDELLTEVYRLLVLNLGEPPDKFTWRYKTEDTASKGTVTKEYTPQEFFEEAIGVDLSGYVALFNYPGKDFYKNYQLELSHNIYDRKDLEIVNVPVDTMRKYALVSVLDSVPVWFACDVGQENYRKDGIMALDIFNYETIYGTSLDMAKKDMIQLGIITPNHAMAFTGVDTANGEAQKWLVENSWGDENGDKGKWYMYNDWFDRYMFGVIIRRDFLSDDLQKISQQEPIKLKPWDPMYSVNLLD